MQIYKKIRGKKGFADQLFPVVPTSQCLPRRQKGRHILLIQIRIDFLLMPWPGIDKVPPALEIVHATK
jgi:hypothetical protein